MRAGTWILPGMRSRSIRRYVSSYSMRDTMAHGGRILLSVYVCLQRRIPHAQFLDIDHVAQKNTDLPHMLPTDDLDFFADCMANLGVSKSKKVFIYDGHGMFSAPRAWWMLHVFGHPQVFVLNGGLPNYTAAGYELEYGEPQAPHKVEKEEWKLDEERVARFDQIRKVVDKNKVKPEADTVILDARSEGRFQGTAPEPRPGIPSGHMPGAINIPFTSLLDEKNRMVDPETLQKRFRERGADLQNAGKMITSCGTGVTASVLYLGLVACGIDPCKLSVYDGSWTEYASHSNVDIDGPE
eukprot:gb/GECG01009964.1/.p1 GENE.gb/GECG01009964.1/~~gb/GECG01009964.1/.p1  ORF type:complete len:297 (+),score=33.47 gb/GECG01009964.1/:1-891(+)